MINEVTTREELDQIASQSAPTWEGLSLEGLEEQLKEIDPEVRAVYCKGSTYNDAYELTGDNRYPADLTIVFLIKWSIPMLDWKFKYGCRWADDVLDNNLDREGKPEDE